jgi:hypothetical protein
MIRLALYKRQKDKHYFDDVIWQFQKLCKDPDPQYIHVELDFGSDMFSSSGRRVDNGTRFVSTRDLDVEKWDFFELNIQPDREKDVRATCHYYTDLGYDYFGIIGMALPGCLQLDTHWYCSEVVNHILAECHLVEVNGKIRPGQILDSYRKQGLIL